MRRCAGASIAARFLLVAFVITCGVAQARPAHAAGPSCPDVGGVLRRDSTRDSRDTQPDGTEVLNCGYQLTDAARGPNGGRIITVLWTPNTNPAQPPQFCGVHPEGTLFDAREAVEVHYAFAGHNVLEFRQVAQALLGEIGPLAASCPASPGAAVPATSQVAAPTRGSGSGGFDPIVGLAAGGVAVAGVATFGVRRLGAKRRSGPLSPQPAPPSAIYDGDAAALLLVQQGWLSPVARPDGTTGWQPHGDFEQFLHYDHGPWQPAFAPGTIGPDGSVVHELVGVAMTPGADGTIDSLTVVTAVGAPTAACPSAPVTPAPSPVAPTPPPARDADGAGMGLLAFNAIIDFAYPPPPPEMFNWHNPPVEPPPAATAVAPTAPTQATHAPTSPLDAALGAGGGVSVITPADLPQLAPDFIAPDGTLQIHGTKFDDFVNGQRPNVQVKDGTLEVEVAMHHARATFDVCDGRAVAHVTKLESSFGPSLVKPDKLEHAVQRYLDTRINGPAAAHGLRIANIALGDGTIRLTTSPVPR